MRPAKAAAILLRAALPLLCVVAPAGAYAHPLDEVVQGSYLTLAPSEVRLELDISPGALVADTVLRRLDANDNGRISGGEARAFGRLVLAQTSLTVDGRAAVWRLESVAAPAYLSILRGDTIKIYAVARRPESEGLRTFMFENRYAPAKTQAAANVFLKPGRGWRYAVAAQAHGPDGRQLTVRYEAARA